MHRSHEVARSESMDYPTPIATRDRLPERLDNRLFSAEVLAFDDNAQRWHFANYEYDDVTGTEGTWCIGGEVYWPMDISHWMPKPPNPAKPKAELQSIFGRSK